MPIIVCQSNKKKGIKYGKSGKCYVGKNARQKAITQMKAIKASQSRRIKVKGNSKRRSTVRRRLD